MRKIKIAATQMSCSAIKEENIAKAEGLVRQAASQGAQIILLQELFETPYFCQTENEAYFSLARDWKENAAIQHFSKVAKELKVVLPISFYERKNMAKFNSMAMIDGDGKILGIYRKSHIPDGPGYEEKFYFSPGDTGFKVFNTMYGRIGLGICWDQWFPEAARIMTLMGAELLLYPTAIGSEPENNSIDSKGHWQRTMIGHSAANLIPLVASNRTGKEIQEDSEITFYGSSFITDGTGSIIVEAGRDDETVLVAEVDLDACLALREEWGVFRDRRPDLYGKLITFDGCDSKGEIKC